MPGAVILSEAKNPTRPYPNGNKYGISIPKWSLFPPNGNDFAVFIPKQPVIPSIGNDFAFFIPKQPVFPPNGNDFAVFLPETADAVIDRTDLWLFSGKKRGETAKRTDFEAKSVRFSYSAGGFPASLC
jgi:hypothetical protein